MPIHDLGSHEGQPFMVLPLMGGGDVEGLIEQAPDHRLPLEQGIDIAKQVCRGLDFAHAKGIVHRDLKPGNVWLTAEGTAKIGDFGLALPMDRPRLTQEGMMVGTVAYMPPEQALGGEITPKADLYSLGAMLYEMVTSRPPFLGDDVVSIIGQHINTAPVAPTWHNGQCPRPLEALILRLLAKDPAERPDSARDVLAALEAIDLSDVGALLAAPDEAHALDSLAGGVFVGRQREMGELKAALEDALSGRGRLVTLVGEPGIGKTRTAQELATYAGLRQCQVLWGRCYEGVGAPPYWPWVQAIRAYVRERDPQQLRSEMGAGAADIAEVVSEVRERLPDLQAAPQLEPEQARFRLFDSITSFLKSASRNQPLVLVLDDLHWADKPSLLLLEFMARELAGGRLLLVGAYRDVELSRQHPLAETLGELTRERLFQRVLLRGLSEENVGRFIELVAGITPPAGLVEAVYRQTEGNPLFVTEVVRFLVQEGAVGAGLKPAPTGQTRDRDSWTVRIPEGVREVIGRRLNRLSQRCNQTLTIASVIGREFTLEQLKPLIEDMTEDRLLEVVEEALSARVIEELPRAVGRYQFTHALIQETLLEELTLTRRVRLHARIAEALEELYGDGAEAHAAELAHHFAEAQTVLGTEKLVRYSLLAGEKAQAAYAWEEAVAHFQRGLAAKGVPLEGKEPAADAEAAAMLFGLGRAQAAIAERFQLPQAVDNLCRAFDYYVQAGDVAGAVAVAVYPLPPVSAFLTGMVQLIARALALVPADSLEAGHLLSRYGMSLYMEMADYQGAQEAFSKSLTIAQREGDAALEMRTLANAGRADVYHLRFQDGLDKSLNALNLARRLGDLLAQVDALFYTTHALLITGDLDGVRLHAPAMLLPAEAVRNRFWLASALHANETLAHLEGNWEAARAFSDRGLAVVPRDPRLLGTRVMLEYEVGDFAQGETYLQRLIEAMGLAVPGPSYYYAFSAVVVPAVVRITGVVDRIHIAEAAAVAILSSPSASPFVTVAARIGLAFAAVQSGDTEAAAAQYTALLPQRSTTLWFAFMSADHVLGLLSVVMRIFDQAATHFEEALAFCRKAGYRPELAWTCCDYADCLLARAQQAAPLQEASARGEPVEPRASPDHRKAMALLDESLAISRELGMRPLMERVLSRRKILTA
jgi:predicted ATPase